MVSVEKFDFDISSYRETMCSNRCSNLITLFGCVPFVHDTIIGDGMMEPMSTPAILMRAMVAVRTTEIAITFTVTFTEMVVFDTHVHTHTHIHTLTHTHTHSCTHTLTLTHSHIHTH